MRGGFCGGCLLYKRSRFSFVRRRRLGFLVSGFDRRLRSRCSVLLASQAPPTEKWIAQ